MHLDGNSVTGCSDGCIVFVRKTRIHTAFGSMCRSRGILKLPFHLTGVSTQLSVFRQEFSLLLALPLFHSPLALVIIFLRHLHPNLLKFKFCFPYRIKRTEEGAKI